MLTGMLAGSSAVAAFEINPGAGIGLEYTDNARLTPHNKEDDLIALGYLGANINDLEGPLKTQADASVTYENYTQNTYSDKYYFNLGAKSGWEMIRDRLTWNIQDYFSQQPVDSLNSDTPDNIQNTNVFTFGPTLDLQASPRNSISISPEFSDFYYENDNTDNQQYGLSAEWLYRLYRTMNVGLQGSTTKVNYKNEDENPNYIISTVNTIVSGGTARTGYSLALGASHISRDRYEDQNGLIGNLNWSYKLTGSSSMQAYLSSELSDSSNDLLGSKVDPNTGNFSNEQISGDVLRNNTARLSYTRKTATLDSNVWTEYRRLNYKEGTDDREVREAGAVLNYQITPLFSSGVYGNFTLTNEDDTDRTDKEYLIGANVGYKLSSKLHTQFDLSYHSKDSTQASEEYNEVRAFINLVYGFGILQNPSTMNY